MLAVAAAKPDPVSLKDVVHALVSSFISSKESGKFSGCYQSHLFFLIFHTFTEPVVCYCASHFNFSFIYIYCEETRTGMLYALGILYILNVLGLVGIVFGAGYFTKDPKRVASLSSNAVLTLYLFIQGLSYICKRGSLGMDMALMMLTLYFGKKAQPVKNAETIAQVANLLASVPASVPLPSVPASVNSSSTSSGASDTQDPVHTNTSAKKRSFPQHLKL
jgi:hypothetical protein